MEALDLLFTSIDISSRTESHSVVVVFVFMSLHILSKYFFFHFGEQTFNNVPQVICQS